MWSIINSKENIMEIKQPKSVDEIKAFWNGPPSEAFPQFYAHVKFLLKEVNDLHGVINDKQAVIDELSDGS